MKVRDTDSVCILASLTNPNTMGSSERQFNALTPEETGVQPETEATETGQTRELIKETETSVAYLGVGLEKATVKGGDYVPKREQYEDYINDNEVALPLQRDIAVAFLNGEPMLVDGGTSLGKTTTVRKMCSELGYEVHYANLNGATDVEDLMGRYIPNPHKRGAEDPEYIFADGKVTSGLRQEKGKVKVIILDEFNASAPNILIRLHEVLDALERGGDVILSEDASEAVGVNKQRTKIIALMNPPGKGYFGREPLDPAQLRRWVYKKLPSELPESTFSHSTDVLFGGENGAQEMPKEAFLTARDQALTPEQLQEIPGLPEVLAKYKEFHKAAKELLKNRKIAEDQPQPFMYDDRMEPRRVRDFILRFYNGDINETFQQALQYYYANKLETDDDKKKLGELVRLVEHKPRTADSRRRGLDDEAEPSAPAARERREAARGETTYERAKEIMGNDFLGIEAIRKAFGAPTFTASEFMDRVPYSEEELEKAKELGEMLVLRARVGREFTMKRMQEIVQPTMSGGDGKLLYDQDWYHKEDFWKNDIGKDGWALVSKELLDESTDKDYIEQTRMLRNYLNDLGSLTADELRGSNDEKLQELKDLLETDYSANWEKVSQELSDMLLNKNHRRSAREALYDWILTFKDKGERLLERNYEWTNTRASGGGLVDFGGAGSSGASVYRGGPGGSGGDLGVVSVR